MAIRRTDNNSKRLNIIKAQLYGGTKKPRFPTADSGLPYQANLYQLPDSQLKDPTPQINNYHSSTELLKILGLAAILVSGQFILWLLVRNSLIRF